MWTTAQRWTDPRGGGRALSCWHKRKQAQQMLTSTHLSTTLLLFDTNYNVLLVLCPTPGTHTSVQRCNTRTEAHTSAHTQTDREANTFGSTAKPMKLSKPQFRGNMAIPQSTLPSRNDSISLLANCKYNTFSSHSGKQAPLSSTFHHRLHASLFCSIITTME